MKGPRTSLQIRQLSTSHAAGVALCSALRHELRGVGGAPLAHHDAEVQVHRAAELALQRLPRIDAHLPDDLPFRANQNCAHLRKQARAIFRVLTW